VLFFKRKIPANIDINDGSICLKIEPKETILQAALRNKVAFPYKCRVGACGTCKCKLISGKVKELTDKAYTLSEEEMLEGYILACQSVPQNDVSITVTLGE